MGVYDRVSESGDSRSRIIGIKGYDFGPRETHLIAWAPFVFAGPPEFCIVYVNVGTQRVVDFDPTVTDLTNHVAFCKGHLPAHAYADWLEEGGADLPAEAYNLLRGWDTTQIT